MKIALTGGTGLVGGVLVPLLLERGHSLRMLVRPRPGRALAPRDGVELVAGRLDELEAIDELVRGVDLILHAAFLHPEDPPVAGRSAAEHYIQTNYAGSMRLLERASSTRTGQLIYVSSLAVYSGDPNADPLGDRFARDEEFPLWPLEFYGAIRAGVEKMMITGAHAFHLNTSVFRLGHVLGMRTGWDETPFAQTVDEALRYGEIRTLHGGYVLGVEDVVEILADAVGDAGLAGQVFNTFDRWLDFSETAPILSRILGRNIGVACAPAEQPRSPILAERIHARYPRFSTDAKIEELLTALVHRRREGM